MIFADKLIQLRKKCGWTQEELAEKLSVTRQSVSKWEGAQSIPELDKILQLSSLFGVSTDYLLRDEIEEAEPPAVAAPEEKDGAVRRVSMEEASAFLRVREETALPQALAVITLILSPVPLLLLGGASVAGRLPAMLAGNIGVVTLLLLVAAAVAVLMWCGSKTKRFAYLETEKFETEYGVSGMLRARQEQLRDRRTRGHIIAVGLFVLSPVLLICGSFLTEDGFLLTVFVCCLLGMVAAGVFILMLGGRLWAGTEMLLEENDYSRRSKSLDHATRYVAPIYWMTAVAIYVGYGLVTQNWGESWVIWPVAALVFVPIKLISRAIAEWRLGKKGGE